MNVATSVRIQGFDDKNFAQAPGEAFIPQKWTSRTSKFLIIFFLFLPDPDLQHWSPQMWAPAINGMLN